MIKKHDKPFDNGESKEIYVVSGCMGSGKTTYVRDHRSAGDLVVDFDYIMQAVTLKELHERDMLLFDAAMAVRDFLYDMIEFYPDKFKSAWIITTAQGEKLEELINRFNAYHIEIQTSKEDCINRILNDPQRKDKQRNIKLVEDYFGASPVEYDVYQDDNRYKTKRWEKLRLAVLKRDSFTCQECKRKGVRVTADTVHHIEPYIAELFYEITNLISFCSSCHNKMHIRGTHELTADGKKWVRRRKLGLVEGIKLI